MRFMKRKTFFWEIFIGLTFMDAVCLIMIILCLPDPSVLIIILVGIMSIVTQVLFLVAEKKNVIVIDEIGITCLHRHKTLWTFAWEQISELYIGSKYRHRTIYVFPKEPPKIDLHTPSNDPDYTFELCGKAKKALKQYCRCPIVKKTTHGTSEWYRF